MKKRNLIVSFTLFIAAGLVYGLSNNLAASSTTSIESFNREELFIGARPSKLPQPTVDVYSVTSEVKQDSFPWVTKLGVRNRSSKNVVAVKVGWRVIPSDRPETTFLKGETPLLGIALSSGERRIVEYPVVNFAEIYSALSKDRVLKGSFLIEVTVTDVVFDNSQSKWMQKGDNNRLAARHASWGSTEIKVVEVANYPAPAGWEACQNQVCHWNFQTSCYQCNGEAGFSCSTSQCSSCTETRCEIT